MRVLSDLCWMMKSWLRNNILTSPKNVIQIIGLVKVNTKSVLFKAIIIFPATL